jgi:DHA1 family tetracycline resistance protein-like MFS transporter
MKRPPLTFLDFKSDLILVNLWVGRTAQIVLGGLMNTPSQGDGLRRRVLTGVFFTVFMDLVGFGMFIPVIPLVARTFGASDLAAVSVASIYSIGTLLAVALLGRLSDRYGRKRLLVATIAVSTVAQVFTGLAGSYLVLLIARFVAGLASGNIAVAQACISDVTKPQERGRSMALIGIAFGLGFSLGPAIGALVSFLYPESALYGIALAAAALNGLNLLLVVRRLPETHPHFASSEDQERQNWWQDLRLLLQDQAFRIVMLLGFLQVFGFVGVEAVLSLILNDAFHITESKQQYLAYMFIGFTLVLVNGAISRPLLGKWGEVRMLNLGQLLLAITMIGLPLVAPSPVGLYLFLAIMSAGTAFANPSLSSLTSRLAPTHQQGFALGTAQTLGSLARIIGPASFGFFYQMLQGPRSLFISAGLMLVGWTIAFFGLKETRRRLLAEKQSVAS